MLLDRMYVAKVTLEAVLIANPRCPAREDDNYSARLRRRCASCSFILPACRSCGSSTLSRFPVMLRIDMPARRRAWLAPRRSKLGPVRSSVKLPRKGVSATQQIVDGVHGIKNRRSITTSWLPVPWYARPVS